MCTGRSRSLRGRSTCRHLLAPSCLQKRSGSEERHGRRRPVQSRGNEAVRCVLGCCDVHAAGKGINPLPVTCSAPPLTVAMLLTKLEPSMRTKEAPLTSSAAPKGAMFSVKFVSMQVRFALSTWTAPHCCPCSTARVRVTCPPAMTRARSPGAGGACGGCAGGAHRGRGG